MKSNFRKNEKSLFFVIIDNPCRVKDAHKIFRRKLAPIITYDNFKNWLKDFVLLQNIYISLQNCVCKLQCCIKMANYNLIEEKTYFSLFIEIYVKKCDNIIFWQIMKFLLGQRVVWLNFLKNMFRWRCFPASSRSPCFRFLQFENVILTFALFSRNNIN